MALYWDGLGILVGLIRGRLLWSFFLAFIFCMSSVSQTEYLFVATSLIELCLVSCGNLIKLEFRSLAA
jgi:hypothetical protein